MRQSTHVRFESTRHVSNLITCPQKEKFVSTLIDENLLENFRYYVTMTKGKKGGGKRMN